MRHRILVLVLLLSMLAPLAAGARSAAQDPDGAPVTTADGIGEDPERSAAQDPDGLRYDPPALAAWLGFVIRAMLAPLGV